MRQMCYANAKQITYVVFVSSDEVASQEITLKNIFVVEHQKVKAYEFVRKL